MIVTTKTITCNGCGWWAGVDDHSRGVSEARSELRDRFGWRVALPGGLDFCRQCVAAGLSPAAQEDET